MKNVKHIVVPLGCQFKLKKNDLSETESLKWKKKSYASIVESLMYVMVFIRPDIAYVVGLVSRFLSNPTKEHRQTIEWILRYLRGTSKVCFRFENGKLILQSYTNANMGGS